MSNQAENNVSSKKVGTPLIIAGIMIIIVLLIVVIVLLFTRSAGERKEVAQEAKRSVVVTEENVDEIAEEIVQKEYIPPGYFNAVMSNVWNFKTGDSESSDAYVANDSANSNDIYFDVFLSDNEEDSIYQSPVIPLGGELKNIKLDKKLEAGEYDCVLIYHLVDDEQNTLSTVRVGLTININS